MRNTSGDFGKIQFSENENAGSTAMVIIIQLAMSVLDLSHFLTAGKISSENPRNFIQMRRDIRLRMHLKSFTCVVLYSDGKRVSWSRVHQRIETERKIIHAVRLHLRRNHLQDFYPLRWDRMVMRINTAGYTCQNSRR